MQFENRGLKIEQKERERGTTRVGQSSRQKMRFTSPPFLCHRREEGHVGNISMERKKREMGDERKARAWDEKEGYEELLSHSTTLDCGLLDKAR